VGTGTFYVPPILPYDNQLPQDAAKKFLPGPTPPTPAPAPPLPPGMQVPPINVLPDIPPQTIADTGQVISWFGPTPPSDPLFGWMWLNSEYDLFVYSEPGVWVQIGTNW
jgi:hypothetical protein